MLGPHTHRDNPLSRIICAPIAPPCHGVSHCENLTTFLFFWNYFSIPPAKMVKSNEKTNTGEGVKRKRGNTYSDDVGGKSLSETSKSVSGQCVGESSTGVKSTVIHTSVNIFESSKRDKPQYFVDVVKDKRRTTNNNLEFLIG